MMYEKAGYPKYGHWQKYDHEYCCKPMKKKPDCEPEYEYDDCDMDCMPKVECKTEKECVKTYKCVYKLYRMCTYRLYKVCSHCGHEYDYHHHHGMCPKCRGGM